MYTFIINPHSRSGRGLTVWNTVEEELKKRRIHYTAFFSKYQKHGIGEDPADAELVEVPNQVITLFPATQEVAGILTAADKTKIDKYYLINEKNLTHSNLHRSTIASTVPHHRPLNTTRP